MKHNKILSKEELSLWEHGDQREAIIKLYKRHNYQLRIPLALSDCKNIFLLSEDKIILN